MLKAIINKLSNPILFYADKQGHSVFRNFCLFKNTGYSYDLKLTKPQVGKILEFRFELEKYLKPLYFIIPIIAYFVLIHFKYTLANILFAEFIAILLIFICKGICSYIYSQYLMERFGKYKLVEFAPHLPKSKLKEYRENFKSKIIIILLGIALFFMPALGLRYAIKLNVNAGKNFSTVIKLSNLYFALYPKCANVYDMRAYALYTKRNYKQALEDYKRALELSGKDFSKEDYVRFANLLYLGKKLSTVENTVDIFNEYVTRKDMSILEQSQMVWIKSLFRIENNSFEYVIQDYNDLLMSLDHEDLRNRFYISSDRAYVFYLMGEYEAAISSYDSLIAFAKANKKDFSNELKSLYAERGFAKRKCNDNISANEDFVNSGINVLDIDKYEPRIVAQSFVVEKF